MKAIIIDDEANNIVVLTKQLQRHFPSVTIAATCIDPQAAVAVILEQRPDLLFLDIDMPELNGFALLEQVRSIDAEVIFVTGYSEYAVTAFDYQASGYITKPVSAEKFIAAVTKALERILQKKALSIVEKTGESAAKGKKIPLSTQKGLVFVDPETIYFCESSGNYTVFYLTENRQIVVSKQLGHMEAQLPKTHFVRIHERYIINLHYLSEYRRGTNATVVLENQKELPVASRRKGELLRIFGS